MADFLVADATIVYDNLPLELVPRLVTSGFNRQRLGNQNFTGRDPLLTLVSFCLEVLPET